MRVLIELDSFIDGVGNLEIFKELFKSQKEIFIEAGHQKLSLHFLGHAVERVENSVQTTAKYQLVS